MSFLFFFFVQIPSWRPELHCSYAFISFVLYETLSTFILFLLSLYFFIFVEAWSTVLPTAGAADYWAGDYSEFQYLLIKATPPPPALARLRTLVTWLSIMT